jgi:hypothetical protein
MYNNHYEWAGSARYNADPQAVGQELERIRTRDGGITVEAMLEEARPDDAPLHPLCTWDDEVAGEKWRKHELRQVPRSLRVIIKERESRPAYVHIQPVAGGQPGYYQDAKVAIANIDEYELAFKSAYQRLTQAQTALADLERVAKGGSSQRDRERRALLKQVEQALSLANAALQQAA